MPQGKKSLKSKHLAKQRNARRKGVIEALETRVMLAANVLTYHNDMYSTGTNSAEVQLTPSNVKVGSFGKLFTVTVPSGSTIAPNGMGQVYAQPLVDTGVTVNGAVHNVVFVATENDLLFAIDTGSGAILWTRSFVTLSNSGGILNNTLNATSISTVAYTDVNSSDINPNIGITGTPVIDPTQNLIFLVAKTKEVVNGVTTFVQRLHAINIADGTDAVAPYVIGATSGTNTNTTSIYVKGTGDGAVTVNGQSIVQFNALTENQRPALSLVKGNVYVSWASHGDNGPYHGWVCTWNVSNVAANGMVLNGVFNTCPNNGEAGVWQGGGALVFEPDDSAFYFLTGNGTGGAQAINQLPTNGNYNESLVKVAPDTVHNSPTNQNENGWGLQAVDFFSPYNVTNLDSADSDFGSGAPVLIPTPVMINGVATNVIVVGGKDGRIFVLNRGHLGFHNTTDAAALNFSSSGDVPNADGGTLSAPAWYNGHVYVIAGYSGSAYEYSISSTGSLTTVSQTSTTFGYEPGSPSISANGTTSPSTNGIVWLMDRNLNELHAYDANSLNTELWNSSQATGGADNPGTLIKFNVPTVANGEVFVGTTNSLVVYGLTPPAGTVSQPPVLSAAALSGSAVNLTWTDSSVSPNRANVYLIQDSTDGMNFTQVATASAGATSIGVGGLTANMTYYFRIEGENNIGNSAFSNVATALTSAQATAINFANGFASPAGTVDVNGNASFSGNNLEITNGSAGEASTAFYATPVNVSQFTTQFTFQISAGATTADGLSFILQNDSPTSLGGYGGGLGYTGLPNSVAIKFDLYSNNGEGTDSTGFYSGGAAPTNVGSIDLSSTGINLHSGDPVTANLSYNGTVLTVKLTDTVTNATATQTYTENIPALIGNGAAYAGFGGGTGGSTAVQNILNWTYTSGGAATTSPNAPTGLGATPATASSVTLSWTNNALNQTSFILNRATDAGFTQNLVTQTISETVPVGAVSYTDTYTGLAPGQTFYYEISAANSVGASGISNVASAAIPIAPAKATNQVVTGLTATEIDFTWQDNAGHTALGYHILRAVNHGSFTTIATLPPTSRQAPSTYGYQDQTVTPGNYYEYHIQAYNSSGYNDFAGVNGESLPAAPTGVTATPGSTGVTVAWSPVVANSGVTYNVYRSSTSGTEAAPPIATGLSATTFTDSLPPAGTNYYYTVTAVLAVPNNPPLPSEGAFSAEASTAVVVSQTPHTLTGTPIGSTGSYQNDGDTIANAFDGDPTTFFDAPGGGSTQSPATVGLDLGAGAADTITAITFYPRQYYEFRMEGGFFEGSNNADFSNSTVLYTLSSTTPPASMQYTTVPVSVTTPFRYVQYVGAAGTYANVAELSFTGYAAGGTGTGTGSIVANTPTATISNSGITAVLSINASEAGNPALTYTWSTPTLPAGVTGTPGFSLNNGMTTGNTVTATFNDDGDYTEDVTISDPSGNSIVVPLDVNIPQVLTNIQITPNASPVSVQQGATHTFIGTGEDQFGDNLDNQPSGYTWAIAAGGSGSINPTTGVYTASGAVNSTATVTATLGTVIGSVYVTTIASTTPAPTPVVATGPTAAISANGKSAALAVTATETGNPALTYTWSAPTLPANVTIAPTFSGTNGMTTGTAVTATFAATGTYGLSVKIADPAGNSIVVPLSVTVGQVLTSISVSPAMASVVVGAVQGFTAIALDQYGVVLATQPTFAWSIAIGGTGTINATSGVYTATGATGTTATVQATSGTIIGKASVTTTAVSTTPATIAGTPIGSTGSYSPGTTIAAAFDGNPNTYFDAPGGGSTASPATVGLDFGSTYTYKITSITFTPRQYFEARMEGGFFEASNSAAFTNPTILYTLPASPAPIFQSNTVPVTATGSFRYAQYVGPANSYGNIAELSFTGTPVAAAGTAPVISTAPAAVISANGKTAALTVSATETGNPALTYTWSATTLPTGVTIAPTFVPTVGATAGNSYTATFAGAGTYVLSVKISDPSGNSTTAPLTVTVAQVFTSIAVTPATVSVVASGTQAFAASALDQFNAAMATQPTFTWSIVAGGSGTISTTGLYTAPATVGSTTTVKATSGAISGTAAVTTTAATKTPGPLAGIAQIGTPGSYQSDGNTLSMAFDGNPNTFFDGPGGGSTASPVWVGLDLGTARTITSISFTPRQYFESRMEGGYFQGSNSSTFATATTLYTISSTVAPVFTNNTVSISNTGTFRYVRYVGPANSYCNIAELSFMGY